jgi:hypothetical protein
VRVSFLPPAEKLELEATFRTELRALRRHHLGEAE